MKHLYKEWKQLRRPLSRPNPNDHFRNLIKMSTKDKTSEYDLYTLDKVTHPTIGKILRAQNQIVEILTNYPCDAT